MRQPKPCLSAGLRKLQKAPVIEISNSVPESPLVSVLVPTYQHSTFIGVCLNSILGQETSFDFEILVGEDESTDGTKEICLSYAELNPTRIRLFLGNRRNNIKIGNIPTGRFNLLYLLSKARGEFIHILEGDDYWCDPNKLQKQNDLLDQHPDAAGVFHDVNLLFDDGSLRQGKTEFAAYEVRRRISFSEVVGTHVPFHTSTFLFQRKLLDGDVLSHSLIRYLSFDMALFALVASNGDLLRIPEFMSVYRKHGGGISRNRDHRLGGGIPHRIWMWNDLKRSLPKPFHVRLDACIEENQKWFLDCLPYWKRSDEPLRALFALVSKSPWRTQPRLALFGAERFCKAARTRCMDILWTVFSGVLPPRNLDIRTLLDFVGPFHKRRRDLVIWGTGRGGLWVARVARLCGCRIRFFLDSNTEKVGKTFSGKEVLPPSELLKMKYPVVVACASERSDEMAEQLVNLGKKASVDFFIAVKSTPRKLLP